MDSQLPDVDENGDPSEKQALLAKEQHFAAALIKEALFDAFESAWKSDARPGNSTFVATNFSSEATSSD